METSEKICKLRNEMECLKSQIREINSRMNVFRDRLQQLDQRRIELKHQYEEIDKELFDLEVGPTIVKPKKETKKCKKPEQSLKDLAGQLSPERARELLELLEKVKGGSK